jgi:general secretion pathway protein A
MYTHFYRLKKGPFHVTPDPEFLFLSSGHKEALASIIYGIEQRKGFIAIVGEVGLGKTTVLRSYLDRVDRTQVKPVYIFNASVTFAGLLKTIFQELGLDVQSSDVFEMVNTLHAVLIKEYQQGRNVVLIIDEAQNMPVQTLENLRMLSNIETSTDKLIQIVLVGQPEFQKRLDLHQLRQLKQRLAIRHTIAPLSRQESMAYIEHRLSKVATGAEPVFSKAALRAIVKQAKGIPRLINILCDNALIAGYANNQKPVSAKLVKEVVAGFNGDRKPHWHRWAFVGFGLICLALSWYLIPAFRGIVPLDLKKLISTFSTDLLKTYQVGQRPAATVQHQPRSAEQALARHSSESENPAPPQEGVGPAENEPMSNGWSPSNQDTAVGANSKPTDESGLASLTNRVSVEEHEPEAIGVAAAASQDKDPDPPADEEPAPSIPPPEANAKEESAPSTKVPARAAGSPPAVRIVHRGDSLGKLIQEQYGSNSQKLMDWVLLNNPSILDAHKIMVGDKLVFPQPPDRSTNRF